MPAREPSEIPGHDFRLRYGQLMEEVHAYRSALAVLRRDARRQSIAEDMMPVDDADD